MNSLINIRAENLRFRTNSPTGAHLYCTSRLIMKRQLCIEDTLVIPEKLSAICTKETEEAVGP
eukprot:860267-Rhodomonas_salina.3